MCATIWRCTCEPYELVALWQKTRSSALPGSRLQVTYSYTDIKNNKNNAQRIQDSNAVMSAVNQGDWGSVTDGIRRRPRAPAARALNPSFRPRSDLRISSAKALTQGAAP